MTISIAKEFTFESAHSLPNVPDGHKCKAIHGHSYVVTLHVRGDVGAHSGWVIDFAEITAAWEPLRKTLDHHYLNEIPGLENPTSERLAIWIWQHIAPVLRGLWRVDVSETRSSSCTYEGRREVPFNQLLLSTIQAVGVDIYERFLRGKGGQS